MPRSSLRSGRYFASICCIPAITRAMPALSSLNADESMMATFVGAGAGRVCVCARIAKAASAAMATIMRNTFIALGSLKNVAAVGDDLDFLCAVSVFSVSLWLNPENHHRDTENTETAQRRTLLLQMKFTTLYAQHVNRYL